MRLALSFIALLICRVSFAQDLPPLPTSEPEPISVTLEWDADPYQSVTYRIYQGTNQSGIYEQWYDAGIALSLTVTNVAATNFFAATALIEDLGLESDYSCEVVYTPWESRPVTNVVELLTQIQYKTNMAQRDWLFYTNLPSVLLTNPPEPSMFFRSAMAVRKTVYE
jgi:hypothetical protein